MRTRPWIVSIILLFAPLICSWRVAFTAEPEVRQGKILFEPAKDEAKGVPEPFQLAAAEFAFEQKPRPDWNRHVKLSYITFPSPVVTPHVNNNTVHCEYFRPALPGKYPAVVVLHILGGDFALSRAFAGNFAKRGIAALFVKLPYYGERRQPNVNVRMVSTDPKETVEGMKQAVKDIRYAAAWLAAQDEVDPKKLGIFGISLGGITSALAMTAEPRFAKCCPLLAGGDMGQIMAGSNERHLAAARKQWEAGGGTVAELIALMKTVDPCSYGDCLRGRAVLMLNAKNDEVIPRACTDRLWEAFGRPPIHWYDAGHYTALWYAPDAMERAVAFFGE